MGFGNPVKDPATNGACSGNDQQYPPRPTCGAKIVAFTCSGCQFAYSLAVGKCSEAIGAALAVPKRQQAVDLSAERFESAAARPSAAFHGSVRSFDDLEDSQPILDLPAACLIRAHSVPVGAPTRPSRQASPAPPLPPACPSSTPVLSSKPARPDDHTDAGLCRLAHVRLRTTLSPAFEPSASTFLTPASLLACFDDSFLPVHWPWSPACCQRQ